MYTHADHGKEITLESGRVPGQRTDVEDRDHLPEYNSVRECSETPNMRSVAGRSQLGAG
jgi:hypothetical protein